MTGINKNDRFGASAHGATNETENIITMTLKRVVSSNTPQWMIDGTQSTGTTYAHGACNPTSHNTVQMAATTATTNVITAALHITAI